MRRNVLLIILAIICLSGCTMIPDYKRPEPPIPAAWPTGPAYGENKDTTEIHTPAEIKWQEFFTDSRLNKLVDMALKNNRNLRVAALNVEKARALYGIQRAELFPVVNASGGRTDQKVPASISDSGESITIRQYSANVGISSWELDFFGRIRSLKEQALEQYLATEQARRNMQISLVAEVANMYMALAAARENLKLARLTFETRETTYNMIRRRYELGSSSELDLRQAQTLVNAAEIEVARYTRQVAQNENILNLLVGASVPPELLPGDLGTVAPPKDVSPGLCSDILLMRPDILQAEHLLKAANANIGAARATFFPRITLTTSIGTVSDDLSDLFKAGSAANYFMPHVVMPIFDTRIWLAFKATEVEREIALAQYEKAIQVAFKEVADALAEKKTLNDQMAAQQSLVDATTETYRLSDSRYSKGIDSYLGVLDAQRSLYSAQQGLIALRLAKAANLVTLYKVLGWGSE